MAHSQDFERSWLAKFSNSLDEVVGKEIRRQVLEGSQNLSSDSSRQEIFGWTGCAVRKLETIAGPDVSKTIMTGCACHYPKSDLVEIKKTYASTKDIDLVHHMLQERFETFLRDSLALDEALVDKINNLGWGLAGVREGETIIATKIPKSANLKDYFQESDPEVKRQCYCHCPRLRDALQAPNSLPILYCYCGAGFYKGIWEEILQQPVDVEVLESVLSGGEVCKFALHLPQEIVSETGRAKKLKTL